MRMKNSMFKPTPAAVGRLSLLLWIVITLMISRPLHAEIFFDSDFEAGGSTDWVANGWTGSAGTFMSMTTEQRFTGSRSLRLAYDNIDGSTQQPSIYRPLPASTEHIFVRFAFRLDPAFQISSNGNTKMMRWRGTNGYPIVWVYDKWNSYAFEMEGPYDHNGNWVFYCNKAPSRTSWDQVEVEYKLNDAGQANGLLRMWVNGTKCIEELNHEFKGPTPTSVTPTGLPSPSTSSLNGTQVYLQSGNGKMFYDRLAVGNTKIGLVGEVSLCGDGACTGNESSSTCAADCMPTGTCGDGVCGGDDTCTSCAADCAQCPVDGKPAPVTDLTASASGPSSVELSFTEVDDGTGQPSKYDIRWGAQPMSWGSATGVGSGSCTSPVDGSQVGQTRTCTVAGLAPDTAYQFQLVSYRGTMNVDAVYGVLSNVTSGTTESNGAGGGGDKDGEGGCRASGPHGGWLGLMVSALSVVVMRRPNRGRRTERASGDKRRALADDGSAAAPR